MNWRTWRPWVGVALAWLAISALWTPAVILIGPSGSLGAEAVAGGILMLLLNFLPWALSVPLFYSLSKRFPLGMRRSLINFAFYLLFAFLFVPLVSAIGFGANHLVLAIIGASSDADLMRNRAVQAIFINGLFALPTYAAMVGAGQTLAYVQRYRERERSLARARDEAVKSYLAPHFLFNALNVISELRRADPRRLDEAISRLARLLRQTLEREPVTSLQEEFDYIGEFLELHRLVLDDRLVVTFSASPDCLDRLCPSLVLQPLVENAIRHGVSRLEHGGLVAITAEERDGLVVLRVVNDAPPDHPGKANPERGIAVARRRLEAVFGEAGRLEFHRAERKAVAEVAFPALDQP